MLFRFFLLFSLTSTLLFSSNFIKSANWSKDNRFIVTFEKRVEKVNAWNFYHFQSKKHKYIYDIDNAVLKNGYIKIKQNRFIDKIVIGQYKADKLRISFRNSKKLKFDYKILKNQIIFNFSNKKKTVQKVQAKTKPISPNKKIALYKPKIKTSVKNRKSKIIVIDAGHGGKDGGAVCKKIQAVEKDIVLNLAKYTRNYLKKLGYTVHLTRDSDNFISLGDRTKFVNRKKADLFISIHANSLPKKGKFRKKNGIETYFLSPAKTERAKIVALKENYRDLNVMSKIGKNNYLSSVSREKIKQSHRFAIDIQDQVIKNLRKYYYHISNGGVKEAPFWVLVGAQMPAVLLEVGYVTGDRDGKRLLDRLYKKRLAKGISLGVEEYFKKN